MHNENNFYLVGKSERDLLCYDEMKDYRYEQCLYFSSNPILMRGMTYTEAAKFAQDNQKYFPNDKLLIYFYQVSESIEEMPFPDEERGVPIKPE
jgi:hypothetical protein